MWTNPLTNSDRLPTTSGEIITAAVAYWEDVLNDQRTKRPRKPADRAAKEALVTKSVDRLHRFRAERQRVGTKRENKLTVAMATADLESVMRPAQVRAA